MIGRFWLWLLVPLAALVLGVALQPWSAEGEGAGRAPVPENGTTGTTGELPGSAAGGTADAPLGELVAGGLTAGDLSDMIGQRVQLTVDVNRTINDVAFWTGSPPEDLLVVLDRSVRGDLEGDVPVAQVAYTAGGRLATVAGVIAPVPYPEAMYSWGLSLRDAVLLQERGVYVHVDRVVSSGPDERDPLTAGQVDEWGRETAPPPGEEVEAGG